MFANKTNGILFYFALLLILYMPLHVFLVQVLGHTIGYLDFWKAAKDLVAAGAVPFMLFVAYKQKLFANKPFRVFIYLGAAYTALYVLFLLVDVSGNTVTAITGSVYNTRLLVYLLLGVVVGVTAPKRIHTLVKAGLVISTLVAVFGVAQYFLPKDLLEHVGYSVQNGAKPFFYINDDPALPRIMSTVRDPNSLGAYLLMPILYLISALTTKKASRKPLSGLLALHLIALYLTYSRASWGGLIIALIVWACLYNKQQTTRLLKKYWVLLAAIILVGAGSVYVGRNVPFIRHEILRINDKAPIDEPESDELHAQFISKGLKGVMNRPLGHGPGTAGIVSIRSEKGPFLTENYYIQIAYEVGILGLALFVALWVYITKSAYKTKDKYALIICAAASAYAVMALVMHLWTNETVALQWWLFAGVAFSFSLRATPARAKMDAL